MLRDLRKGAARVTGRHHFISKKRESRTRDDESAPRVDAPEAPPPPATRSSPPRATPKGPAPSLPPGDGVLRVDVEGCYHSPLGAGDGRRWYGEAPHLEQWAQHVDFVLEPASAA